MPPSNPRTHPARARLDDVNPRASWAYDTIDQLHQRRDWPDWVYCRTTPFVEALPTLYAGVSREVLVKFLSLGELSFMRAIEPALTMAAWRMTQGIYRLDPAVYEAVIETPLDGEIPAQALLTLPEWCVYVETPGLTTLRADGLGNFDVVGAWARLDIDDNGTLTLVIAPDVLEDPLLLHQHVPLTDSIAASIEHVAADWRKGELSDSPVVRPEIVASGIRLYRAVMNLLLYIAATNDFSRRGVAATPANPSPVQTRRHGVRLFPADGPTVWDVGVRMGAALRAAYQREQTGADAAPTGRSVRPHVRRAHWHTFVSGPRLHDDGTDVAPTERRRDVRWMPPIAVNLDDPDALSAVVRNVK
jgi:hypothetical protein